MHHDNLVLQTLKDKPDINQRSKEIYAEKFGNIPIQERIDIDSRARIAMKQVMEDYKVDPECTFEPNF